MKILLLGAKKTGKTTFCKALSGLPPDLTYQPTTRPEIWVMKGEFCERVAKCSAIDVLDTRVSSKLILGSSSGGIHFLRFEQ